MFGKRPLTIPRIAGRDRLLREPTRRAGLVGLACAAAALIGTAVAGAASVDELESRIDSGRQEAQALGARIQEQGERIAALEQEAAAAASREEALIEELEATAARARELAGKLDAAGDELDAAEARLDRAQGQLADRLVEIYKSPQPDYMSLILSAEGFDDLTTRANYLRALEEYDERLAGRVADLEDEVEAQFDRIAAIKEDVDDETERLHATRLEISALREATERKTAELATARDEQEAALAELRSKIDGWIAAVGRKQVAEWFGPYAIPYGIVMCESGGNYRALNPSSGAGGAYQILPSTWRAYGGKGLPHQASKREQDRIASLIWRDSGPGAWVCAG